MTGDFRNFRNSCDDGKCPLNRQGITHETHELIEGRLVKNPCNDARCAMNRMGIKHNNHDIDPIGDMSNENASRSSKKNFKVNMEPDNLQYADTFSSKYTVEEDVHIETPDEAMNELLKRISRDQPSQFYTTPRNNSDFLSQARTKKRQQSTQTPKPSQKAKDDDSEIRKILDSQDPHDILGVSKNATIDEIKARYRDMAKKYDPSQGIIHKSTFEKERSNKIMTKINNAFVQIKRMHKKS